MLDGPLPPLAIPTTLQASLVARLDRLGSVKDVAQIGAAIGREFSHELIAAVSALAADGPRRGARAADRLRPHLPARNAAGRDLRVQARAGAGRRLRHDAQEPAAAVACEHRQGAGRAVPGDGRKPARGRRPPFHRGRACQRGDRLLAQGGSACAARDRPTARLSRPSSRRCSSSRRCRETRETLEQAIDLRFELRTSLLSAR